MTFCGKNCLSSGFRKGNEAICNLFLTHTVTALLSNMSSFMMLTPAALSVALTLKLWFDVSEFVINNLLDVLFLSFERVIFGFFKYDKKSVQKACVINLLIIII